MVVNIGKDGQHCGIPSPFIEAPSSSDAKVGNVRTQYDGGGDKRDNNNDRDHDDQEDKEEKEER